MWRAVLLLLAALLPPGQAAAPGQSARTLLQAAAIADADLARRVLEGGWQPVGQRDSDGRTALMKIGEDRQAALADAQEPAAELARLLLAHGAAVDERDRFGWTALSRAASAGFAGVARELLAAGADADARENEHLRAPLHLAAVHCHAGAVEALLRGGAPADVRDASEWTPLMLAVVGGNDARCRAVMRLLLDEGRADIDAADRKGKTAIMYAAHAGHVAAVRLLLEHRPDTFRKDHQGFTALSWATLVPGSGVARGATFSDMDLGGDVGVGESAEEEEEEDDGTTVLSALQQYHVAAVTARHRAWMKRDEDYEL